MNELELHNHMLAVSTAYRLSHMDPPLRVDGVEFDLRPYPYLWDLYDDEESPKNVTMKGAQLGFTTLEVLRAIDRAGRIYPRGILYLFPTREDVTDFSRTRFQRILDDNPALLERVRGTDSANVKQVGDCFIYFRGAKSRSQLKSIPVDAIVFDEFDEMTADMVALARQRLAGSKLKHEFYLSTPTFPEFGIHYEYLQTDMRKWLIKCRACNEWTCLEDQFPDTLRDDGDRVHRACFKCSREVFVADGEWVAQKPGRDARGNHVSQLCSPTINLAEVLEEWKNPRTLLAEFYNSRLGLPYADILAALDEAAILACCGPDARRLAHDGPCFAGADVGQKEIFYGVGSRRSESFLRGHAWYRVESFQDVHDLNKRYNVECGVMDAGAETRGVRDFVASESGWWGCLYTEQRQSGGYSWDPRTRMVSVNRTESLDDSHKIIVSKMVEWPRPDQMFREFVMVQLKNLVRMAEVDAKTGETKIRWVRRGAKNDDFRHTWNYMVIASQLCSLESSTSRLRRTPRTQGTSFMSA